MLSFTDCIMVFQPLIWCRFFAMSLLWFLPFSQKCAMFFAIFCRDFLLSQYIICTHILQTIRRHTNKKTLLNILSRGSRKPHTGHKKRTRQVNKLRWQVLPTFSYLRSFLSMQRHLVDRGSDEGSTSCRNTNKMNKTEPKRLQFNEFT